MAFLNIKNLNKYYTINKSDRFHALKDINLTFESGEIVSIIGESGSGKSTLMNLIGGLDLQFDGEISLDELSIQNFTEKEIDLYRKNKIGFIFQSFNLIPHLSVLDNVTIAMTLSNIDKKQRLENATEILTSVGLEKHIHKKPNQLSGGQKQRVAIARALINDPDIILADEPTGALDSKTSSQVLEIIQDIAKQGKLVIMVTHSDKVAKSGTRIVRIDDGEITETTLLSEPIKTTNSSRNIKKDKQNLSFVSAIKLALYNMKQKFSRNVLVALGSSIGIMSVILMLSVSSGVKSYVEGIMNDNVNPLVVEVSKQEVRSEDKDAPPMPPFMQTSIPFTDDDINKLSSIENVSETTKGYTEMMNPLTKIKFQNTTVSLQYLTTVSPNVLDVHITEGAKPAKNEILIDENVVKQLDISNSDILGKTVSLTLPVKNKTATKSFVVSGIYKYDTAGMAPAMTMCYANYDDLSEMFSSVKETLSPTEIFLSTTDKSYTTKISENVKSLGFSQSMSEQMLSMFNDMLDVVTYILSAVSMISLFVSAIMILVVLHISVVERTGEIGVLKAIGARVKDIRRIFVAEAFLVGLFGGLFAVGEASLIALLVNQFSMSMFSVNLILISPEFIFFGIATSVIISMLSGVIPARKAAKLDPIESLRHE